MDTSSARESVVGEAGALAVPVWMPVVALISGLAALHIGLHYRVHGVVNVHQAALAIFLAVNTLVNVWELVLLFRARQIRREYEDIREPFRGQALRRSGVVFSRRIRLTRLLSPSEWTGIWSTYALLDEGYVKPDSYGFHIDVGNGLSTIVPATLFAFGMTFDVVPARWLGIIGVAMFWQMLYGTFVYAFQFVYNRRYVGHPWRDVALLAGGSNSLWIVGPIWGIAASVALILSDSYALFG